MYYRTGRVSGIFVSPAKHIARKKVMLDSSSRKAGGVGVLMEAVGGGGKKYKHFQEGRDVTHKSKRKKGKSPSTTKINDPFLAVILFLSPLYTRTL